MDKNQLLQLRHIKREIRMVRDQLLDAESSVEPEITTDSVKGSYTCFPYIQHTIKISGVDYNKHENKVKRLKHRLHKRLKELTDQYEELNKYISDIEDSEMRQIFTLRYLEGLSWQQIAANMGVEGDGSTERKKHNRFLKIS